MPIYEFRCECGERFDDFQHLSEVSGKEAICPFCGTVAKRSWAHHNPPAVHIFKEEYYTAFSRVVKDPHDLREAIKQTNEHREQMYNRESDIVCSG
jgi:putative FmdB family regulatory protein